MLLPGVAESDPHESSRADGVQGLHGLPCVVASGNTVLKGDFVGEGFERVQPYVDTVLLVSLKDDEKEHAGHADGNQPAEIGNAGAADVHHDDADAEDQNGARKVRLPHHEHTDQPENPEKREKPEPEALHFFIVERNQVGKQQDDCKFGQLRGLELPKAGHADPAVHSRLRRHEQHQRQQSDGYKHQRNGKVMEDVVIDQGGRKHDADAEHGEQRLLLDVEVAVAVVVARIDIAGREHADKSDAEQQHQDNQQRNVDAVSRIEQPALRLLAKRSDDGLGR